MKESRSKMLARLKEMRRKHGLGEFKKQGSRKRSVHMARGRRAQRRRIGSAINWLKGGMLAKSMLPAFAIGVFGSSFVDNFAGNNQILKYGILGAVGGAPAIVGSIAAPMVKGAVGLGSGGSGTSTAYYG